jgi:hypothetical protein
MARYAPPHVARSFDWCNAIHNMARSSSPQQEDALNDGDYSRNSRPRHLKGNYRQGQLFHGFTGSPIQPFGMELLQRCPPEKKRASPSRLGVCHKSPSTCTSRDGSVG